MGGWKPELEKKKTGEEKKGVQGVREQRVEKNTRKGKARQNGRD